MTNQTTSPLTEQQLDQLEALAKNIPAGPWTVDDSRAELRGSHGNLLADLWDDRLGAYFAAMHAAALPLVSEVRRLRAELATALRSYTPRLCECGHSNLAHTVPAPHSCFAHGQTCPCPAYRQLPHDEAVAQLKRNQQAATALAAVPAVEAGE